MDQARFDRIFALAAGAVFLAALLGLLVWFSAGATPEDGGSAPAAEPQVEPRETPTRRAAAEPPLAEEPRPTTAPATASAIERTGEPARDLRLPELRESDAFAAFAEHERAGQAGAASLGYDLFAPHRDGEIVFEWSNKAELWDGLVPGIRDQCLLAGAPRDQPLWDSAVTADGGIDPGWSTVTTQGRGQFVDFLCRFVEPGSGVGVERWWAALIATDAERNGRVVARMPAFDVRADEFASLHASREAIDLRLWSWVLEQAVVEAAELPS